MRITARQIERAIPDAQLLGDEEVEVKWAAPIDLAGPESLSWLRAGKDIPKHWAGAVLIIGGQTIGRLKPGQALVKCGNPRLGLGYALRAFFLDKTLKGPEIVKGEAVWVDSTAVIGAEGCAYEWDDRTDSWFEIPHIAGVMLGDDVRIGPLATVMRGLLTDTLVGAGTKIGNHANVGHGAQVGRHCLILPYATVGGSSRVGDQAVIGMGAVIRNGLVIGEGAIIGQGANVVCDVPAKEVWVGNPARKLR